MKLYKENPQYWLSKGYTLEEAAKMSAPYIGSRSKYCINYYLIRGISHQEAEKLVREAKLSSGGSKNARMSKCNGNLEEYEKQSKLRGEKRKKTIIDKVGIEGFEALHRKTGLALKGKRPSEIEYWVSHGYSVEDSKKKVSEFTRSSSKMCVEYWIKKGHTEDEAILQVSLFQDKVSLEAFIGRYGDELGKIKYDLYVQEAKTRSKMSVEYWIKKGHTEDEAILQVSKHQSFISSFGPHKIKYWINLGYSEKEAEIKRYEYIARKFKNTKFYWLDLGYSEEDAERFSIEEQSRLGKIGAYRQRFRFKSSMESKFNDLTEEYSKIWTSHVPDKELKRNYFPDFEFEKFFVEIYGDYWHMNPKLHGPESKGPYYRMAKVIWEHDEFRKKRIEKITGKPVIIIWESDFKNIEEIKEKINELSKN